MAGVLLLGLVASPVRAACEFLIREQRLATEGLFRKAGRKKRVEELIAAFDIDPHAQIGEEESVATVCSFLVQFFMRLPAESLWGGDTCEWFSRSKTRDAAGVRELVHSLPAPNRATLKILCSMLHEASKPEWAATNRMEPSTLAMCVYPKMQKVLAVMIEDYPEVFLKQGEAVVLSETPEDPEGFVELSYVITRNSIQ